MKIAYSHLVRHINENPSLKEISDYLFQLGHEHADLKKKTILRMNQRVRL